MATETKTKELTDAIAKEFAREFGYEMVIVVQLRSGRMAWFAAGGIEYTCRTNAAGTRVVKGSIRRDFA